MKLITSDTGDLEQKSVVQNCTKVENPKLKPLFDMYKDRSRIAKNEASLSKNVTKFMHTFAGHSNKEVRGAVHCKRPQLDVEVNHFDSPSGRIKGTLWQKLGLDLKLLDQQSANLKIQKHKQS